jgi:rhamnosyltransferase
VPKRVLVLLATHNGMRWIGEQIQSILIQANVDVTVLASDDASTDGTFEFLAAIPNVTLLPERGPYGSAGKNFFHLLSHADYSTCELVALADQDDIWFPWKLSRAAECMRGSRSDAYGANVTAFWENGQEALIHKAFPQRKWDFLFEAAGPGCTYVFSPQLAQQMQTALRTNPWIAETIVLHDWFVYAWARSHGFAWFADTKSVMRYRQHGTNEMGVNAGAKAVRRRLEWLRSGWYRDQVEGVARACGMDTNDSVRRLLRRTVAGRLSLAANAPQCRRRLRDAFVLAMAALVGWF